MTAKPVSLPFISDKKVQPRIKAQAKATKMVDVAGISGAENILKLWLIYLYRLGNLDPFVVRFKDQAQRQMLLSTELNDAMQFADVAWKLESLDAAKKTSVLIGIVITKELSKVKLLAGTCFTVAIDATKNSFKIIYQTTLLKHHLGEMLVNMPGHIRMLADGVAKNPQQKISLLPLMSSLEKQQVLVKWNKSERKLGKNKTIQEVFEISVKKFPDKIAVVFEEEQLTYQELNQKANQVAHTLRKAYGKSLVNVLVGICVERSLDMLVGILGILKAGAAYVPLDSSNPESRLTFILQDSKMPVLLTQSKILQQADFIASSKATVICLDSDWDQIATASIVNPKLENKPSDLAYVIYTSGTTGAPKGVLIPHSNVHRLFMAAQADYNFNAKDVWSLFHSYAFDVSVWEMWGALFYGGCLVVVPYDISRDPQQFYQLLAQQKVTVLSQTPSAFYQFINVTQKQQPLPKLRYVVFAGEALNFALLQPWWNRYSDKQPKLVNMYGITETTVHTTYRLLSKKDLEQYPKNSMIGTSLADLQLYILDQQMQPVPIGVVGELYVGGAGLAQGYLNRSDLTKERFIINPITKKLAYKSGDLVRWFPNGDMEYIGRSDNQVKIRGFRIELGEIEAALAKNPEISQCVVIVKELLGEKQLVGYFVAKTKVILVDELRKKLAKQVPDYMIPAFFVELQTMPLTPNGKIDKRALPEPKITKLITTEHVTPRNDIERKLAEIWSQILYVENISINVDFFHLGGNSLSATQLITRINHAFHIDLAVKAVFDYTTIAELSDWITEQQAVAQLIREPIKIVPRGKPLLLSFAEQRLWFLSQYETSEPANYNIQLAMQLLGKLDVTALEKSVNYLIKRHEVFHSAFPEVGGEAKRVILPIHKVKLTAEVTAKPEQAIYQAGHYHFDLAKEPLLRVKVFKTAKDKYILFINQHHIISDGWSVEIFIEELSAAYTAFANKRIPKLPKLTIQYADYANWQRHYLTDKHLAGQLDYWSKQLVGYEDSNLPTDFPRPPEKTYHGKHYSFLINKTLTQQIKDLTRETGTTLFMVLLTVFKALLYRYSGQEDILVGSPIANRRTPEVENIIGFFVNTLALRTDLSGNPKFIELLAQVKQTCLDAYANQDVPFEKLVEILKVKRDVSRSPIFQLMFVLQSAGTQGVVSFPKIKTERIAFDYGLAKFDMLTELVEVKDGMLCTIEYNTDLFAAATITKMAKHFQILLRAFVKNPQENISSLPMLMPAERNKLLSWNRTERKFASSKTLPELFVEQVNKTPDQIAVIYGDEKLTYKQLNQQANQVAHTIRSNNKLLEPNSLIAISAEPSLEMIIGILGILKAGFGYVPLDPDYPEGRLTTMLKDSAVEVLLSQQHIVKKPACFIKFTGKIIYLDDSDGIIAKASKANPKIINSANDTVYVIYTSGSTGTPKGILLPHTTITNLVNWQSRTDKHKHNKITQFINFGFDVSLQEIFYSLLKGHELHVIPKAMKIELDKFLIYVQQHKVNVIYLPTAVLESFAMVALMAEIKLPDLRQIIVAGEALKITPKIRQFFAENRQVALINNYGPSETHVVTSYKLPNNVKSWQNFPPIGNAVDNTKLYIFDKHMQLVPVGVPGELYVAGIGVAHGYLNQAKLTQEKFIINSLDNSEIIYKTGDLVKRLADGNIAFLGRIDNQVKIRGFRIELGEIEAMVTKMSEISQCVVIAKELAEEKQLIAYFVPKAKVVAVDKMRKKLEQQLPAYMIPTFFVQLKTIPLTPNGKIDKRALPEPEIGKLAKAEYVAPRNEIESKLAEIWSRILQIKNISVNANFFFLGGHSLNATKVISRINHDLRLDLVVKAIFDYPTIAELSVFISKQLTATQFTKEPIKVVPRNKPLLLSFAEQRLWFLNKYAAENSAIYNLPIAIKLAGKLNIAALQKSINYLLARHETLHTIYPDDDGKATRRILAVPKIKLTLEHAAKPEQTMVQEGNYHFDLAKGPLLRVKLLQIAKAKYILFINQHHVISDGWSIEIFIKELAESYNAFLDERAPELPQLEIQYADFANWQRKWLSEKYLAKQLEYWQKQLAGYADLNFPTDFPRPAERTYHGKHFSFTISNNLTKQLNDLTMGTSATLFMVLLAAFKVLLYRYSGQEDILVGAPIANRRISEVENVIGFFVNTLVLRSDLSNAPKFRELLAQVKQTCLDAYVNQDLPFERLVEVLNVKRDVSRNPFFQMMFVLQSSGVQGSVPFKDLQAERLTVDYGLTKIDLLLELKQEQEGLLGLFEYNTDLFTATTIAKIAKHYTMLLHSIVQDPELQINQQLLYKTDYTKLPEPKLEQQVTYLQYVAPRTDTEKILVDIWCKVLNFTGKIGIHDSFFEIGGHSILTVKMLSMIQEKFKVNISIAHIFRSPTIAALAEYIDKSNHPYLKNTNIDFAMRDVHKRVDLSRNYISDPKKILLTGVTGFLGSHLLTELLSQTDAKIYCLIRGKDAADIENRFKRTLKFYGIKKLADASRIKLVKGDLEQEHLGLSKAFVTKLINEFDHICHNGAFVHHMYGYRMLRPANVLSTIELLKIAATGKRKVLSFISTIATASCYDKSGKIIEAEFTAYPPTANGYVLSKWTAEKILKAVRGENINIFRPGYIMGHSKTGVIQSASNHALALLKSCVELGVAPDWKMPVEMTPVDILSKAIVKLSLQNLRGGGRDYNMYNPCYMSWIEYINLVKDTGIKIEIVPEAVWQNEYLRDIDEANALYALREFYLQQDSKEAEVAQPLLQSNVEEVQRMLHKNDIYYPTDYEALLTIYIKYLQDTGFLP